jgi:hypothetical protein
VRTAETGSHVNTTIKRQLLEVTVARSYTSALILLKILKILIILIILIIPVVHIILILSILPTVHIEHTVPELRAMYYVLCIMYHVLCTMYYVLCIMYYVLQITVIFRPVGPQSSCIRILTSLDFMA